MSGAAPTLDGLEAFAAPPHQWRLAEIQLANWGTFDGAIYRIPIGRRGHLVTGPSGSGKSSLLDAIAAVLVPDKWLRFNQAAQGAESRTAQRSTTSYVRGAWSKTVDEEEDRVVSRYLRPRATWSGIVLRYQDETGHPLSLGRLFFLRGGDAVPGDLCILDRSALDLDALQPFAIAGIETRKLQARWPDAVVTTNGGHGRFYARMRSQLGIANEGALQLLHKTQSAKSLDSLDQLLRDFMLDVPATFEMARTAVAQFGELRDAHGRVVALRRQRDQLLRVREVSERLDEAAAAAESVARLADAVVPYQQHESHRLGTQEREAIAERLGIERTEEAAAERERRSATEAVELARRLAEERGGADAEQLRHRIRDAEAQRAGTAERYAAFAAQLEAAGIGAAPSSPAEFAELIAQIDREVSGPAATGPSYEQHERHWAARRERDRVLRERDSVRRSGVTVPERLVRIRTELAAELSLREAELPFAAELIEVREEFAEWTGAIERVLRPFSTALLVRTPHLPAVRRWVDARSLGGRLVFEEVGYGAAPARPPASDRSLIDRVRVASGVFEDWMQGQLSERFDFACVDSPDELHEWARAVTVHGQVKSSRTRYEKDDRTAIGDRSTWVLGDREAKLEALVEALALAEQELADAEAVVARTQAAADTANQRIGLLRGIRATSWASIDRESAGAAVAELRGLLDALTRDRGDLRGALDALSEAEDRRAAADRAYEDARLAVRESAGELERVTRAVADLAGRIAEGSIPEVDEPTRQHLAARFRAIQRSITRQSIVEVGQQVLTALYGERDRALGMQQRAGTDLTALLATFRADFPAASADLTATIEDRSAFLALLDDILAHGLPEHEANFRTLLRERSRDLIGGLVAEIRRAPREIADRVVPVNESLRRSRFDEGRFLRLRVKQRWSETVKAFVADLVSVSEGSWGAEDLEADERRFATLEEIMRKLDSSEHIDRTWRTRCLDTRQHVTFLADEIDERDEVQATYDSGAAMSGGQQQKLVIFCLAAALRYQLADADDPVPRYGTVVLDEAFDKADTRYTRMALDVFVEFGFQMVLATPQKLVQTIEPYVGAATSVENPTRMRSEVASVVWENTEGG